MSMFRHLTAVLLIVAVARALTGCDPGDDPAATPATQTNAAAPVEAPASPAATAAPATITHQGPHLQFERTTHDFGTITDTRTYQTSFAFANTGSQRLVIDEVKAACGCTVPTLRRTVFEPGDGDVIDIVFDPEGKQGHTPKEITVISNSVGSPQVKLELVSTIEPIIAYERMQDLGVVPLGEGKTQFLDLTYNDPEIEFKRIWTSRAGDGAGGTTPNPDLQARLVETGPNPDASGRPYRARIELTVPPTAPWGLLFAARVHILVRGKPLPDEPVTEHEYTVFAPGNVFGELHAQPSIVGLNLLSPHQNYEKAILLSRPTGEPFEVIGARITEYTMPGVSVSVEPVTASVYRIVVSGNTGSYVGSVRGKLMVQTNVPGEEQLEILYTGSVRSGPALSQAAASGGLR